MMKLSRRSALAGAAVAAFGCGPKGQAAQEPAPPPGSSPAPLDQRKIPSSGQAIPIVGLGTWQAFDVAPPGEDWDQARAGLAAFAKGGGRVVDSSPMYGQAEAAIGALSSELGVNDQLFVATKVWTQGRAAGIEQMRASMAKLRRRKIDLMQVHNLVDVETHLATLAEWKAAGTIGHIGVTHYTESGYYALERVMRAHQLDTIQINYSAAEREAERRILPMAQERGIAVIANRPFAGGDVFRRLREKPLPAWAAEIGCASWAQVMLKFVLSHPALTCAIPGTRNPRYVLDNLGAGSGPMPDAAMRDRIAQAAASA